ncbi:MAG: TusE/DsrC/DsvC family sulfur relay protein [Desulfobacterales bacterium]|nr:TusE/DsrC/DsvC family sulfur relay protein [Desulfobacterales bacterium]
MKSVDSITEKSRHEQAENAGGMFRFVAGSRILFDRDGFLWNPEDWSREVAEALAVECGLHGMNETHWNVIRFMRDYYSHYGRAPLNAQLKTGTGMKLIELESLFPRGIKHGARRIAGLPNPKSCSD